MAFGTQELVIVLVAFFVLFGAERLPKLARSMGQAKGEFHQGLADVKKAGDITEEDMERGGEQKPQNWQKRPNNLMSILRGKLPKKSKMRYPINQLEN